MAGARACRRPPWAACPAAGTVPRAGRAGRARRAELSASCGTIAELPAAARLLLLQRWPRASCSYHVLPESQRAARPACACAAPVREAAADPDDPAEAADDPAEPEPASASASASDSASDCEDDEAREGSSRRPLR